MRSDPSPAAIDTLRRLGFNELEAMAYCELIRVPASTGYAIAKAINRPHANVYQALNALEAKGAVLLEQGTKKTYSAVPSEELLSHLKTRFDQECALAEQALNELEIGKRSKDAFYKLTSRDQLFARARALLAEVEEMAICYVFPGFASELRADIAAAHERGVKIAGLVFRPEDLIAGTGLRVSEVADQLLNRWSADLLILVVDGRNSLIAMLRSDSGELLQALWMNSNFASTFFHNALISDIVLHQQEIVKSIGSINKHVFGGFAPSLRDLLVLKPEEGG